MKKMEFLVEGMMCSGCSSGVEKLVSAMSGVRSAKVTLENKKLEVEADENVAAAEIIAAVTDAGFEVSELQ